MENFINVAAITPQIKIVDITFNTNEILKEIAICQDKNVNVCVLPDLAITGASIGDLFFHKLIKERQIAAIDEIRKATSDIIVFIGVFVEDKKDKLMYKGQLVLSNKEFVGIKLSNTLSEKEARYFSVPKRKKKIKLFGRDIKVLENIFSLDINNRDLNIGIIERVNNQIGNLKLIKEADLLVCSYAHEERLGDNDLFLENLVNISNEYKNLIIVSTNSSDESTSEGVYCNQNVVINCGSVIKQGIKYSNENVTSKVNISEIVNKERDFLVKQANKRIAFSSNDSPFSPLDKKYLKEILLMQALGLKRRIEKTGSDRIVLGLSGGLDSVWALIVATETLKILKRDTCKIVCITMPCFGTSQRTLNNAIEITNTLNIELKTIDISQSVKQHLEEIGHDGVTKDVVYENAQARERTQVLFDFANMTKGIVIGTGDLSENILGWATYNGDQMSSYSLNSSLPKTLIQELVVDYANKSKNNKLKEILLDVFATPISPELIPCDKKGRYQKTEDIIGPYELHDYFIYYTLVDNMTPIELYKRCVKDFKGKYKKRDILKYLEIFYKRFILQQFKRSCMPDSPCANILSISPRSAMKLPSDLDYSVFMEELSKLG